MFRINILMAFALTLSAQDQTPGWLMSGSATLASGVRIRYRTIAHPPLAPADKLDIGGMGASPNGVHRSMSDAGHRKSFGYDVSAEIAAPGEYRVTFAPLSLHPEMGVDRVVPKLPPQQIVRDGETIALDVLVSADGQRRIVDYIQFETVVEPAAVTGNAALKDYTLDDGVPNIDFLDATFWINGRKFEGTLGFTRMRSGATLWMAIPGEGRVIFSPVPVQGFRKTGAIRDHVISFSTGNHSYELRTQNLIFGSKGAWALYVYHDRGYTPRPAVAAMVSGGIDRLANLLPERR
jgi:hypothetical protein